MRVKYLFITFSLLIVLIALLYGYLSNPISYDKKLQLVKTVGLPDLAISTEANFIRNRSLATMMDIYKDDPDIRVYFPSSFAINEGLYEK